MNTGGAHEFDVEEITELLAELDVRLRRRGVAAAIFVVGGAAIAATGARGGRLTEDVDALTRDEAVLVEARRLARERGLPVNWLNPNAKMWMPPLPKGVLEQPARPGLRITYADDNFLFATKLIAQRAKDADDLVALAERLGLLAATPEELEVHIRRHYTNEADLEFIIDGTDVDREIAMLARDAARMLARAVVAEVETVEESAARLHQSKHQEQRHPPSSMTDPPDLKHPDLPR